MALVKKALQGLDGVQFECWITIIRNSKNEKEFWFRGNDFAAYLRNARKANIKYFPHKWKQTWFDLKPMLDRDSCPNWKPQTIFINRLGLFRIMIYSKHPEIVSMRKWIYKNLIPSLECIDIPPLTINSEEVVPLEGTSTQYAVMTESERMEWLNSFRYKGRKKNFRHKKFNDVVLQCKANQ